MEKNFCSPYEICIWEGTLSLIFNTIILIVANCLKLNILDIQYPDNFYDLFGNYDIYDFLICLIVVISMAIYNIALFTTCYFFDACYILIISIIIQFYYSLKAFNNAILNILSFICLIIVSLVFLVYIEIIEVNISCPNVHNGGMAFGTSPDMAAKVTAAVKKVTTKPVYVKLSPNVTDIVSIARACEDAGADGLTLINTILGMRIDIQRRKPVLAQKMGGYSGPAIFPIAVRMVYQVAQACHIPIMGCGGVATAEDVIEMMMAGATAVQVGAENLHNPYVCKEIIEQLSVVMNRLHIDSLEDIIGIIK